MLGGQPAAMRLSNKNSHISLWETSPAKQAKKSIDSLYVQLQEKNRFEKTQPV